MAGNVYSWSTTAASNATVDADVNWAEGQLPGTVNGSARGMMAGVAGWLKDTNGTITTGGAANAYTVTSNVSYSALATGIELGVKANHSNTGAATLTLNALTSKAIRVFTAAGDAALSANMIRADGQYQLRYDAAANGAAGAWILLNPNGGYLLASNNLSDVASAATAFSNIKQAASDSATGVVELATTTEAATGTDTSRAVTPAGLKAGAGWWLIQTQTASSSATLDFTTGIDSTYDAYLLECIGLVPETDSVNLWLRVSEDAGSNWKSGVSDYKWAADYLADNASVGQSGDDADSEITITGSAISIDNNSGRGVDGRIEFWAPSGARMKPFMADWNHFDGGNFFRFRASGVYASGNAINGVRLLFSSGNIASGTVALYGLRKS